jgi:hypothetical protein
MRQKQANFVAEANYVCEYTFLAAGMSSSIEEICRGDVLIVGVDRRRRGA